MTLSADTNRAALASNRSGGHGSFDIYESAPDNNHWSKPRNAGAAINTEAAEFDPALSPDGLTLYFVRVMPDVGAELFVARRESLGANWSAPRPVEAINSPAHERSPSVSPDGSWLLFASNRSDRAGETAPFGLFRAPLTDGGVGAAERLRDGIASDADDVDAAFGPDGQLLVFASKREGAKQIYLSRGDFVETQLTVNTAHLERFGWAKWWLPSLSALMMLITWKWSRRTRPAVVVEAARTSATAKILTPPKRSAPPPPNPLANWTPPPAEEVAPTKRKKAAAEIVAPQPSQRRQWAVFVMASAAAVLFLAIRDNRWKTATTSNNLPISIDELGPDFARLTEITPPRASDLPKLERTNTARTDAPQSIAPPSNVVALRPAARWPTDQVVVRQRSVVDRASLDELDQRLMSRMKFPVIVRMPLLAVVVRPIERPAEEVALAVAAPTAEKPHSLAPLVTTKLMFDPRSTERTEMKPAAATQSALRAPAARVSEVLASLPIKIGDSPNPLLARVGAAANRKTPISTAEPEALNGSTATLTVESPLPARAVSVAKTETNLASQPTTLSNVPFRLSPIERRSLPLLPPDRNEPLGAASTAPMTMAATSRLPAKSVNAPKTISLTEEVAAPAASTSPAESNTPSPGTRTRGETNGPQSSISATPIVPMTTVRDLAALRTASRIEPAESAMLAAKGSATSLLARRTPVAPGIASVAAADVASGGAEVPAILVTSASKLVELLPSAPVVPLPRTDSAGSATTAAPLLPSQLAMWLSRAMARLSLAELPAHPDPTTVPPKSSLPRRVREATPAEVVETIATP